MHRVQQISKRDYTIKCRKYNKVPIKSFIQMEDRVLLARRKICQDDAYCFETILSCRKRFAWMVQMVFSVIGMICKLILVESLTFWGAIPF